MEKDLSIIIVNYNTKDLLKDCLNSIILNTKSVDYEIIVIDNASSDGSVEMVKVQFKDVILLENKNNLGFSKANNIGIHSAKGRHILLLNSDTIIIKDCLLKVLKFAQENEEVGIVGCKVLNTDKTLQYSCYHNPSLLSEIIFFTKDIIKNFWDIISFFKRMKYWDHSSLKEVDCVAGCFFWVKRAVYDTVGLLDEKFFMYYEDSEFCVRVKKLSKQKIYYYPDAEIIHLKGKSENSDNFSVVKYAYTSAKYYFNRCYGEKAERYFNICCKIIWQLEKILLSIFICNKKVNMKVSMLKELCNL